MTPLDLRRYRAERLLRRDFEGLRSRVLGVVRAQLRGAGVALAAADLEACYAQAWHGLYASVLEGEQIENPAGWLVRVTFRRAVDEHRAARARGLADREDPSSYRSGTDGGRDLDGELEDRVRLRHLFEGLRARMSAREREAASLCYLQGLSRAQAAERMGVSEARMRKLMEGAGAGRPGVAAKMGELVGTIAGGGWCEQQGSLMRAYAFGLLDLEGERYALAAAHCDQCPACRAYVASLRGLAAVLPLPLLPQLAGGASGAASATTAKTGSGFASSLTAKLAVTGIVVLGTGYAVIGTRAHGSPRHSSAPVPVRPSVGLLARAPGAAPGTHVSRRAHTHVGHPKRRVASPGRDTTRASARAQVASSAEFGPERATGEALPAPTAGGASPPSSGSGSGEFGLE